MSRGRRLIAGALLIGGAAAVAAALATPAKAVLGQLLLERAFAAAQAGGAPSAPWPGADLAPMAKLGFPSLGAERLVLDKASGEAMAWGPGHVTGTAAFGAPGVSAAAAHRDTHFALIQHLAIGDPIWVETLDGRKLRYVVRETGIVDARRWRFPPPSAAAPDILALATCWPFDSLTPGPERYVVFAEPAQATLDAPDDSNTGA